MYKLPTKLIAVAVLISTTVSSLVAETAKVAPLLPSSTTNYATLMAPTVTPKRRLLDSVELAKYQAMAAQSQSVAGREAAGASDSTKTTLLVISGVVVAVGIIALLAGSSHPNVHFSNPS